MQRNLFSFLFSFSSSQTLQCEQESSVGAGDASGESAEQEKQDTDDAKAGGPSEWGSQQENVNVGTLFRRCNLELDRWAFDNVEETSTCSSSEVSYPA
jgi:hypothetical protein